MIADRIAWLDKQIAAMTEERKALAVEVVALHQGRVASDTVDVVVTERQSIYIKKKEVDNLIMSGGTLPDWIKEVQETSYKVVSGRKAEAVGSELATVSTTYQIKINQL